MGRYSIFERLSGADATEESEYECEHCGAGFERRRQACSECGSYRVVRREWEIGVPE